MHCACDCLKPTRIIHASKLKRLALSLLITLLFSSSRNTISSVGHVAKAVVGSNSGGYPCFFFAAVDPEEARIVYGPEPSAMQKRCKITRCVYQDKGLDPLWPYSFDSEVLLHRTDAEGGGRRHARQNTWSVKAGSGSISPSAVASRALG